MDCKKMQDRLLGEYPDKELGPVKNAEVEGHLAGCAGCREFYVALQAAAVAPFREAKEILPDEVVWLRIREQIDSEKQHAGGWFGRLADLFISRFPVPIPLMRAGFVTALILVVVVLARWPSGSIDPAYAYMEEQMTFMTELGAGNTDSLNGDLKDYDAALEAIG